MEYCDFNGVGNTRYVCGGVLICNVQGNTPKYVWDVCFWGVGIPDGARNTRYVTWSTVILMVYEKHDMCVCRVK